MPSVDLGKDAVLYLNAGSYGAPFLVPVENVRDLRMDLDVGEVDVSPRDFGGWAASARTIRRVAIDFNMLWVPTLTAFQAIRDAYLNGADIEVFAMSKPILTSGAQGLRATVGVFVFRKDEPLEGPQSVDVTLKPVIAEHPPQWV